VAPPPDAPGLTYEVDLLATEALFYETAAGLDVPLPRVVHLGAVGEQQVLVLTVVDGEPVKEAPPADPLALRRDLGGLVARLHTLRGERFGYPQLGLHDTWREAFGAMVAAAYADAHRFGVELPVPADALDGPDLDEVTEPVLVHFDLWDGNLFVDPDASRVAGIIDAERAFWGDPLADFASLPVWGDTESDLPFLEGYGELEFTPAVRARIARYRAYLDVLMLVETVPRRLPDDDGGLRSFVGDHLRGLLDQM
jgi:aminoglycoside phosphotransferase (APT) family kinase protein